MKIAICYAGQKRSWDKCIINNIQNLLDDRCTIFSCTDQLLCNITTTRNIIIDDNLSLYADNNNLFYSRKNPETTVLNCLKMYYSIYKVMQLKKEYEIENNMIFDVVIRVRPDTVFDNTARDYIYKPVPNTIILPADKDYGGLCDQFWFSNSQEADRIATLFLKIGEYFINENVMFHPETLLHHHCKKLQLAIDRTCIKFNIIR